MRNASAPKKSPIAVYSLRIDRERLERLTEIAASEHRTLAQELRRLVDERIEKDAAA